MLLNYVRNINGGYIHIMELKDELISLNIAIQNEYLDMYCTLIENNRNTPKQRYKTNKHHIIPRNYFKENNRQVDNSQENIVNLTYADHFLAHYYLSMCCVGRYKFYNELAVEYLQSKYNIDYNNYIELEEYQKFREQLAKEKGDRLRGKPNPHTDEWNNKISKALTGKPKSHVPWNKGMLGVMHHTPETKKKIGEATKNRPPASEETREKCRVAALGNKNKAGYKASDYTKYLQSVNNGRNKKVRCIETGEVFYNLSECCKQAFFNKRYLIQIIKEKRPNNRRFLSKWTEQELEKAKKYQGYTFEYVGDDDNGKEHE